MKYDKNILNNYFQSQKVYLEALLSENIGLKNSITNIENALKHITDAKLKKIYEKHLNIARTNLEINELSIKSIKDNITQLSNASDYKLSIVNEEINIDDIQVTNNIIYQRFDELKKLYNDYKNENDLDKKKEILNQIEEKKDKLSSLKSKISCRMRKLKKTEKISEEEYKKFKEEQIKYNKEHYELYAKINKIKLNNTKQEENNVTNLNRMKDSKNANDIINHVNSAINAHNSLVNLSVNGSAKEIKEALKEEKKAQKKVNIVRNPKILKERDQLAKELSEIMQRYGTANNEEYQMRLKQLKDIDKIIFGHKAKKIYKDFKKPVRMIGGSYVELPKEFTDMRLSSLAKTI